MSETTDIQKYETIKLGVHAHYTTIDWRGKLRLKKIVKTVDYTHSPLETMRIMLEDGNFDRLGAPIADKYGLWSKIEEMFGSEIKNTNRITLLETDVIPEIGMKWVGIDRFGDDKPGWRKA